MPQIQTPEGVIQLPYGDEGGGPPPGLGAPQGAPPGGELAGQMDLGVEDRLRGAIELLQSVLVEEPDDADSQALSGVIAKLYQLFASRQKDEDSMLGMNPGQARTLRRVGP